MSKQQSCRTCAYWNKPPGARALADRAYPCTAPLPPMALPDSVTGNHARFINPFPRSHMTRDEGKTCPCYEIVT